MPHSEKDYMGTRNPEFTTYKPDFDDNLPLDGEVYVKDDVRVYLYHGYHAQDINKCAVSVKGELGSKWVDRSLITPLVEA